MFDECRCRTLVFCAARVETENQASGIKNAEDAKTLTEASR